MLAKSAVVVALLASFGAAQSSNNSTIDPTKVSPTLRAQWCSGQQSTCPLLCGGLSNTPHNDCDVDALTYLCTCKNGTEPGLKYYTNTLPTFICEQVHQDCIVAGQNNQAAQKACNDAEQANCGKLDPNNYTAPAASSSSASGTAAATAAASSGGAPASATSKAAAATMAVVAREYGSTGLLAAGAVAAFGLML